MSRPLRARWWWALAAVLAVLASGCEKKPADVLREARLARFEKNPQEALRLYRHALDLIERDETPEAQVLKARALRGAADTYRLDLDNVKEAVAVYRELIAQCPEAPETLEARIILADLLHIRFNDLRGAITELTAALTRNPPEGAELNYKVAKLYFQLQDYQQADLEAQRVATRYETSAYADDALMLRAQALAMMDGKRTDAIRAFEDLIARFPDSELVAHALFEIGKLREDAGEPERAIELWVRSLATHPQPNVVQEQIARVRNRIANTTATRVGNESTAFDRDGGQPVVRHASSEAALAAPSLGARPGKAAAPPPVSAAPPAPTPDEHAE